MKGQKKLFKDRKNKFIGLGYDNYDAEYWKYVMTKRATGIFDAIKEMYYYGLL